MRAIGVVALLAVPFVCAAIFMRVESPGSGVGVFLETDRAYKTTLRETDRALHALGGYVADQPGASAEAARLSPTPVPGRRLAFYLAGPKDSALILNARTATLWCLVVDGVSDTFRSEAVAVPATITEINPGAYRVTSTELENVWGADRLAFRRYAEALEHANGSRTYLDVMMGLEVQDTATGARRMYSVRVGPPR